MEILSNPPIIEAQIGIRFDKKIDFEIVKSMSSRLMNLYPVVKPRIHYQTELKIESETQQDSKSLVEQVGFQQNSNDNNHVVLVERDHLVFCRVNKYPGWESFKESATNGINSISEVVLAQGPFQVFSRYINNFKLTLPFSIEDYFNFLPQLPETKPGVIVNDLQYNFSVSQNETGVKAIISFFPHPDVKSKDSTDFILDLSIVCPARSIDSAAEIWDSLEKSRDFKNTLFLGLITDKLKARYK